MAARLRPVIRISGFVFMTLICAMPAAARQRSGRKVEKEFVESWRFYQWRIEEGDNLKDLEYILERIQKKYAGAPVNHTMVERELKAVRVLKERVRREEEEAMARRPQ